MLTDRRMTRLLDDLLETELVSHDHRGPAFSYPTVVAAVASEWHVSIKVARETLSNWLAGRGQIAFAGPSQVMIVYKDSWAALHSERLTPRVELNAA